MRKFKLTIEEKNALPFVLPGVLVTAFLVLYPLIYVFSTSFREGSMGNGGFAGLANYKKLFQSPQFHEAMNNTVIWMLATVFGAFVIGFILALLINKNGIKNKGLWRSLIFIAWIIPGVVKATAWKWLLSVEGGMVNYILERLGAISEPIKWLSSPRFAMVSVILVQIWATAPYVMLMLTAGLQQIPESLYESAGIDGATVWNKLRYITFPMLKDSCFICILMLFVWAINEFSLIFIMTSGGNRTTTLPLLIFNQFKVLNINVASASAVMQLIITIMFAIIYVKAISKEEKNGQ